MTDYTPIQQQLIKQVESWLTEKPQSDYGYSAYAAYAGRLAALGNETYLRQLETWLKELPSEKRNQIFLRRFDEGLNDLMMLEDERLGCCITEAQDFWCFANHTSLEFSDSVLARLHEWCEEAEYAPLNAEAVDFIKDWKDSFPIPKEEMLLSVSVPLDADMERILHAIKFPNEGKTVKAEVQDQSSEEYCRYHITGPVLSANKGILQLREMGSGVWQARWSDMPCWPKELLEKQSLHVQFMDGSSAMAEACPQEAPAPVTTPETQKTTMLQNIATTVKALSTAAKEGISESMQWLADILLCYDKASLGTADSENSERELNLKWTSLDEDNPVELYIIIQEDLAVLNWDSSTPLVQIKLDEQVWDIAPGQNTLTLSLKENLFNAFTCKHIPLTVRLQGSDDFIELVPEEY